MAFRAFVVDTSDDGVSRTVTELEEADLPAGEVLIDVAYSGVNYKDGLASIPNGRVARTYPLVPGIDLAGTVIESDTPTIGTGTQVIVHGHDLGVAHHGGFAERARVPAEWVVPLPAGLTPMEAMVVGTAGYTAALSVMALEAAGLEPGAGPVLVTGATGGVGSTAVGMLGARGYHVVASTGKLHQTEWLESLGAAEVIDRSEFSTDSGRPLLSERWAGAVDCVGGTTLSEVLKSIGYGGSVAASGNTGGGSLATTVFPFILRGVNLLGIDSVQNSLAERIEVWHRIAGDLRPPQLDRTEPAVVGLDELPAVLDRILAGEMVGHTLVNPKA
jgi:acrylyl-CoA reductase (NADPH)